MAASIIALGVVAAIAVAYTALALFLQRKLSNPRKMRDIQRRVKENTKALNEMAKSGAPREAIMAKQKEVMPLLSESMKGQMKPMFVVLPLFLAFYYALLPYVVSGMGASSSTVNFIFSGLSMENFFFAVVFILGICSSAAIMIYDRRKGKQEERELALASQEKA